MIIDRGTRASGKSTRAVLWAIGDVKSRVLVTHSAASADYLRGLGKQMGYDVEVIFFSRYLEGALRGRRGVEVYIDEILMCLNSIGGNVSGVSGVTL